MTLLEQVLPTYEVNEVHTVEIQAAAERVYEVLKQYRFGSSPLFRVLFGLRRLAGLPMLLTGRTKAKAAWSFEEPPIIESKAFVKVAEAPNEEVVLGLIGKFWEPAPKEVQLPNGEAFLKFDDPAYAKAAMNFRLVGNGDGRTRLSTETRVRVPDLRSRRLFKLYWAVIGFFSGWLRADMLKRIKDAAEEPEIREAIMDSTERGR
ncbi:MAG TPA: hypothetical protein VJ020_12595 [Anaerolineales bacterium]|nr:hypothetical protein [Anaerolineales bacterium]